MAEAIELFKQDGTAAGIFFCSQCRIVYASKEQAQWCHGERICGCGAKITQGYYQRKCGECDTKEFRAKQAAKESERFENAAKIKAADYTGEHVYCGDQFYDSVDDTIDQYLEGHEPEYVWACTTHGLPAVDLEDVTTNLLESMWEDADTSDLNGLEELEVALIAFNKANESIRLWEPDYSTAILISPTPQAKEKP